jgi:hypothetical protein
VLYIRLLKKCLDKIMLTLPDEKINSILFYKIPFKPYVMAVRNAISILKEN